MNDKFILIRRRKNVETGSEEHESLGTYPAHDYACAAAEATKINKREFLIVCDIADMYKLTKNVPMWLYAPDEAGNSQRVYGNCFPYGDNWLMALEGRNTAYSIEGIVKLADINMAPKKIKAAAASACVRIYFNASKSKMSKSGGIRILNQVDSWCYGNNVDIDDVPGRSVKKSEIYYRLYEFIQSVNGPDNMFSSIVYWCANECTDHSDEMAVKVREIMPTWLILRYVVGNKDIRNTSQL